MNTKARKLEVNLMTLGTGVIMLGAWSFIKFALSFLMIDPHLDEVGIEGIEIIYGVIVWSFAAIDFLIFLYIGLSARSEAKGKRKRCVYLILTGFHIILYLATVIAETIFIFTSAEKILTLVITIIIDSTTMVILFELMLNAVRLRRLRKKEAQQNES